MSSPRGTLIRLAGRKKAFPRSATEIFSMFIWSFTSVEAESESPGRVQEENTFPVNSWSPSFLPSLCRIYNAALLDSSSLEHFVVSQFKEIETAFNISVKYL